ncbi:MAG: SIMPL domain-containing protein [Candidatus Magasanikbacteria bacterium]|nr:SIMPL domain-containing protein [Candidatus Magasanikbacteria bacterium]
MPVKKTTKKSMPKTKKMPMHNASCCTDDACCQKKSCCVGMKHLFCGQFAKAIIVTLFTIFLAYLIVFVGTLIRNNIETYNTIGFAEKHPATIVVEGTGEGKATPDIASVILGSYTKAETVVDAQNENNTVINGLIVRLKELGIETVDIKTQDYNVSPEYTYNEDEGRTLVGYVASQNINVKIRNVDSANQVLAIAAEEGLDTVRGLDFTLDDREVYIKQAREEAMEKVREKARVLTNELGVNVVRIISYNEYESGNGSPLPFARYEDSFGGGLSSAIRPEIEAGSTDVVLTATVTLEIR